MNTQAQVWQEAGAEPENEMFNVASQTNSRVDSDAAHSRENISRWSAYLPKDCINAMIKMDWDKST